ncbi:hypothetical protein MMC07_005060 [Pseudocyphellaria aurata]|nr:hypothetical protein [Pseudocyphellaria aurata]
MTSEILQIYDTFDKLLPYEFDTMSTPHFPSDVSLELPFGDEERRIGGGSFGEVYKMKGVIKTSKQDIGKEIPIAMKVIDIGDRDFSREIEVPRNRDLREGLVHLYGSFICYEGPTNKMLCLLSELADRDLESLLRNKPRPEQGTHVLEACFILLETLAFYHAEHEDTTAAHYDLKPGNILIFPHKQEEARWKIGDFGMALIRTTGEDLGVDPSSIGSKMYLPPEYFNDDDEGLRANVKHGLAFDVWAMGCILLEVLTWEYSGRKGNAVDEFSRERKERKQKRQCNYIEDRDHYKSFWNSQEVVDEKLKQLKTHKDPEFRALVLIVTAMLDRNPKTRFETDWIVDYGLPYIDGKWRRAYVGLIDIEDSDPVHGE